MEKESENYMAIQEKTMQKDKVQFKEPGKYKVVMYNDDFTPMDFVVTILIEVFHKSEEEAIQIMFHIHNGVKEVIGEYAYDIARTKVAICTDRARTAGYPFLVKMEH